MTSSKNESQNNPSLQEALADISLIRRTLETVGAHKTPKAPGRTTIDAHLILQILALIGSLALGIAELLSQHEFSYLIYLSKFDRDNQVKGMSFVAYILVVTAAVVYYVVWRAACRNHESIEHAIAKNFSYLKNLSLLCDLFVKFCIFFLVITAQKPEWVAPLLLLFMGDFLVQGKFFTLSVGTSLVLGIACFVGATSVYLAHTGLLVIPFFAFSAIAAMSVGRLLLMRTHLPSGSQAGH